MGCLTMAPIKSCIPMNLRNNKLEYLSPYGKNRNEFVVWMDIINKFYSYTSLQVNMKVNKFRVHE